MLSTALLLAASMVVGQAEKPDLLHEWANDFGGTWTSNQAAERELPGLLKQGETFDVISTVKWALEGSVLQIDNIATKSNGQQIALTGLIAWDPSTQKVKMVWFHEATAWGELLYRKEGDKWIADWSMIDTDGTRETSKLTMTLTDRNTQTYDMTNRMRNNESLPDQVFVLKRK